MRPSSMTAIAEGPAAPLSPRTRADLRADRPPPPAPFVRSESGRRLARALDRFARGERDRDALLVHGPQGSGRSTVVLRAVEQAMVALTWLDRPVQLLPVPIRTSALFSSAGDRFDEVRVVGRFLAVAALTELVERLGARAGDDAERAAAVEAIWQALRGVPERDELRGLRSDAEPRYALFDDDDDLGEDESVAREANVLWQAVRLRGVRKPTPPAPIVEQIGPAVDPAVVEALRDEVGRLSAALAERDAVIAHQLDLATRSTDPSAVVLAAIAGAGLGLHFGVAGGIAGGIVGGGLGFALSGRGSSRPEIELEPLPPMADPPPPPERPTEPMAGADEHADEAVDDGPPDIDALIDLLRHFIHDLRTVGYAPVFILDELDRAHRDPTAVEARIARLLADLPDGACAILVAEEAGFAADVPEITERLPVAYTPAALHAYLDRRLALPDDLSETAAADARLDKSILRYALLHASRMRPDALDRMLADRRLGGVRLDAQAPRSVFSMRIRAAQQMALEVVLAERGETRTRGADFNRVLGAALQLPLVQWETGQDPDVTVDELATHLDLLHPGAWDALRPEERDRIWNALGLMLGLMSSRAGLVSRLSVELAPLADLIPDAPLVVRHGESWTWAFDAEGRPTAAGLGEDAPDPSPRRARPADRPSADEMGARFRAIAGEGLEAPRRLSPGDPLPVTGEHRAYPAGLLPAPGEPDGSLDGSVDASMDDGRGALGTRRPLIDAAEAARFLEGVDEALAGVGEGALSVGRLARVGLVPTIPTPAAVARALTEGDTPHARVVLDEAVGRIRERLGVIEKFALWLTAARTLVPDERIGTLQIAATLVKARALRGRQASAQHAHLVNRVLQSELRSLCPRLRLKTSIFRRQANPGTDPDALARWGEVLRRKCDDLAEALSVGTTDKSLDRVAWRALRTRLRLLVIDGEAGLPTFAEAVAALVGVAGATVTDWLSPEPTARNLSALLLAAPAHSEPDRLGDGGLYAALALGLNQNGTDAVGLELPDKETSEAGDLIRESARARAPVALVLTTDPTRGLAASRPPRRGSALVLTPDEVITSTKKLGFEVIFLDDPGIDAGMLPLPPAPVLAPPQTDDIDAALGWWTTHR